MEQKKREKNEHSFVCVNCDYVCRYLSDWERHNLTAKHKRNCLEMGKSNVDTNSENNYDCLCGKVYNTKSGLWKHKQKCSFTINNNNNNKDDTNDTPKKEDLINFLMKENSEFKNLLLEQHKMFMDMMKNNNVITNNINTNMSNSNNKTFNLQVFLNETCKDAMNISEFIENISLQLSDLENMGKLGYVEGVSNIIIKNLNALDVTQRPLHCTDKKRETVYVKEDDEWQKEEDDKKHIKSVISSVVSKNLQLLPEYENKYPQCMNPESKKSDEYNKIIMETMGGGIHANGEKNKEKIIRKIAKEVAIEKN